MTTTPPRAATSARLGPGRSIPIFTRLLLRGQLTRSRVVWLVLLSAIVVVTAVVSRGSGDEAAVFALGEFGLAAYVPLVAVLLATPILGDLVEDRLLVYLWLKPTPRWHLAVAAYLAAAVTAALVTVPTLVLGALISSDPGLTLAVGGAALLGVVAYCAAFVFLGARFSFGLWIGLAYVAIWENLLARLGDGAARISIRSYLMTVLERSTTVVVELADRAWAAALIVPPAIGVVFVGLTALTLQSRDID
ncbi:MAG: hypothetical protein AAF567_19410 [Actinomycetota bacterium]